MLLVLVLLPLVALTACGGEDQEDGDEATPRLATGELPNPDVGAEDSKDLLEPEGRMEFEMPALPSSADENIPEFDEVHGVVPEGETEAGEYFAFGIAESFLESDAELVGAADNVLAGTVVEDLGDNPMEQEPGPNGEAIPPLPTREFVVEVNDEVKGSIADYQVYEEGDDGAVRIVVSQFGGKLHEGLPVEVPNGDPLLKVGSEYVLLLAYDEDLAAFVIVSQPEGDLLVDGNEHKENLIARFDQAYDDEVPIEDVLQAQSEEEPEDEEAPSPAGPNADDPDGGVSLEELTQ